MAHTLGLLSGPAIGFESADGVHGLLPSCGWPNLGVALRGRCTDSALATARSIRFLRPNLAGEGLQNSTATIGYRPPVRFPILFAVLC